jgi:acyl-CoA reductase-like NAD-dependent aldehyde dehydrogenase
LVCGTGERPAGQRGFFVAPAVFADVTDSMRICREEIFGPVMSILKFDSAEEALRRANQSEFGLVGSVFTANIDRAMFISERLRTGIVWVNTYNYIDAALPWCASVADASAD